MKKIFTLFVAFIALTFCAKAQVALFSENFDSGMPTGWTQIDANNDNYGWDYSSNPASYFVAGTDLSGSGHNSSTGFVLSGSYTNVSQTAITPDNWLITPAITLTGNADLSFYVCGQDANYSAEHYGVYITTGSGTTTAEFTLLFEETIDANGGSRVQGAWGHKTCNLSSYTGQTVRIAFRHFNCNNEFVLNLDDVEVLAQPTDPTIIAAASTIDFGTIASGSTANATVNVTAYNLTAGVTATTTAPFAVSADGTTFGTTATIAAAGGTLYVQYAPTAVGTDNGTVTLASTGATDVTITVSGNAIDCSNNPIPYSYSFTSEAANQCWEVINANNDDYTFEFNTTDGNASIRWNSTLAADDWLISPVFTLTGSELASFDYMGASSSYTEKYQVFAIGTDTVTLTPVVEVHNTAFETQYLDLSALTGSYRIAIHGISDPDQFRLYITNFNVIPNSANITVSTDAIDFGTGQMGNPSDAQAVVVTALNLTDAVSVSVAAPFEISSNGTTFGNSLTFPASTAMVLYDTFYVRFAPTAAGTFSQNITVSSGTLSETIALTGSAVDCSGGISQFPHTEGFENGIPCWTLVSMDPANDGMFRVYESADLAYEGNNFFVFSSYNSASDYNQYLITPELNIPAGTNLMFDFQYMGYSSSDNFKVMYSTTTNDISAFTELADYQNVAEDWTETAVALPAGTKYVAINYYGDYAYYLFVDNVSIAQVTAPTVSITGITSVEVGTPAEFVAVSPLAQTYAWTVDGTAVSSTTNTLIHTFTTTGNHTVGVTVTNSAGTANATLTVNAYSCDGVQSLPYFEGFEGGIGCWNDVDNDADGYSWESSIVTGVEAYEGIGCMMSNSYVNNVGPLEPDNWLISPAIAIPSEGATLTWFVAGQDPSYPAEHYDVKISTSTALNSFTSLFNETLTSGDWEQRSVNISGNYAGQNVYIAFQHHDITDMFAMKIDNVSVTAGVGIENHETTTSIYPNPAKNVLNITSNENINRVEVFNMMGQMVGSYDANDTYTQINTTAFANGVYTVKIETENGTTTRKFTVAR